MSVPTAHDSIARWVKDAGGKPETSIPVNVVMLARLVMEYESVRVARDALYTALGEETGIEPYRYIELKARIDADDLADSEFEPLRMAGVDAEELSAIVDDLKMLYREAQEEGLA